MTSEDWKEGKKSWWKKSVRRRDDCNRKKEFVFRIVRCRDELQRITEQQEVLGDKRESSMVENEGSKHGMKCQDSLMRVKELRQFDEVLEYEFVSQGRRTLHNFQGGVGVM